MKTTVAFFDFDGTLIKGDSIFRFCIYSFKNKHATLGQFLKTLCAGLGYLLSIISASKSKEIALSFCKNKDEVALQKLAESFCNDVLIPSLYVKGQEEIKKHLDKGTKVILVSASPEFYLMPLKNKLKLTDILATPMEFNSQRIFTGKVGNNCKGEEKPIRINNYLKKKGIELNIETSSAYGDTASDYPMMKMVNNRFIIRPKRKLSKLAKTDSKVTTFMWN